MIKEDTDGKSRIHGKLKYKESSVTVVNMVKGGYCSKSW